MSVINTNVAANNTYRLMSQASEDKASSMEKLSSGLRINRAADDAAGLSIAEGLKAQSKGLEMASRNANDAVNLLQTAEGGLASAHDILQRVRELAVQAGNDSNNAEARTAIKAETDALGAELGRMADSITFNGIKLLNGATSGPQGDGVFSFQIGSTGNTTDRIEVDFKAIGKDAADADVAVNLTAVATAVNALDFSNATTSAAALVSLDTQIANVSTARSGIGAVQNRLEHTIKHVEITQENLASAESNIRDVDMAKEIVKQSAASIKEQASQAMLAQANQASQGVLQLLR
jgi:flagellin